MYLRYFYKLFFIFLFLLTYLTSTIVYSQDLSLQEKKERLGNKLIIGEKDASSIESKRKMHDMLNEMTAIIKNKKKDSYSTHAQSDNLSAGEEFDKVIRSMDGEGVQHKTVAQSVSKKKITDQNMEKDVLNSSSDNYLSGITKNLINVINNSDWLNKHYFSPNDHKVALDSFLKEGKETGKKKAKAPFGVYGDLVQEQIDTLQTVKQLEEYIPMILDQPDEFIKLVGDYLDQSLKDAQETIRSGDREESGEIKYQIAKNTSQMAAAYAMGRIGKGKTPEFKSFAEFLKYHRKEYKRQKKLLDRFSRRKSGQNKHVKAMLRKAKDKDGKKMNKNSFILPETAPMTLEQTKKWMAYFRSVLKNNESKYTYKRLKKKHIEEIRTIYHIFQHRIYQNYYGKNKYKFRAHQFDIIKRLHRLREASKKNKTK